MALIVGHNGPSSYANSIANRTAQSGGSVGGDKKAGIFGGSVGWPRGNIPASVFWRAPQRTPTLLQMALLTTRNPNQLRRGSYAVTHSGVLG
jgi:hypothetical protein